MILSKTEKELMKLEEDFEGLNNKINLHCEMLHHLKCWPTPNQFNKIVMQKRDLNKEDLLQNDNIGTGSEKDTFDKVQQIKLQDIFTTSNENQKIQQPYNYLLHNSGSIENLDISNTISLLSEPEITTYFNTTSLKFSDIEIFTSQTCDSSKKTQQMTKKPEKVLYQTVKKTSGVNNTNLLLLHDTES